MLLTAQRTPTSPGIGQTPFNCLIQPLLAPFFCPFALPTSTCTLSYKVGSVVAPYFSRSSPSYQLRSYSPQNSCCVQQGSDSWILRKFYIPAQFHPVFCPASRVGLVCGSLLLVRVESPSNPASPWGCLSRSRHISALALDCTISMSRDFIVGLLHIPFQQVSQLLIHACRHDIVPSA